MSLSVLGVGGSILFTAASVVVLEHFDKRASLIVGIAGSGASAGTVVIPLLSHACIDAYGFRGTFLILSGVGLQCLIASLTFTPPPIQDKFEGKYPLLQKPQIKGNRYRIILIISLVKLTEKSIN